jgi:DNA polymerase III subunit epsilon
MTLQLLRPIVFFDLETTGLHFTNDRIVEICMVKIKPDMSRESKTKYINPEIPIPAVTTAIHGITDEMVANAPTFKQAANEIRQFMEGSDWAGYNSNKFDIPFLMEQFLRIGLNWDISDKRFVDVQHVFHKKEPRNLAAAYKFYCNKSLENAHSAEYDVNATIDVFMAQLQMYPDIEPSVEGVIKFTGQEVIVDFAKRMVMQNGVEVFNFGKHKGKPVATIFKNEPSYYDWMMKGDFAEHTKAKITEIFNRTTLVK